jgi:hypothetical protein
LLDTQITPNSRPAEPTTVIRMQIQPRHRIRRRQQDRQLQLCVPLVTTKGDSHRLAEALAGKGVIPLN